MAVIALPRILREKLTDEGAEALLELFNKTEEKTREVIVAFSEEKYERRLSEESAKLRVEMANMRADIIRWMFIFIFGQFWAIVGVLFAFFRK